MENPLNVEYSLCGEAFNGEGFDEEMVFAQAVSGLPFENHSPSQRFPLVLDAARRAVHNQRQGAVSLGMPCGRRSCCAVDDTGSEVTHG